MVESLAAWARRSSNRGRGFACPRRRLQDLGICARLGGKHLAEHIEIEAERGAETEALGQARRC